MYSEWHERTRLWFQTQGIKSFVTLSHWILVLKYEGQFGSMIMASYGMSACWEAADFRIELEPRDLRQATTWTLYRRFSWRWTHSQISVDPNQVCVRQESQLYLKAVSLQVCRMQRPRIGNLSEIECPKEAPQSVSEMSLRCRAHDPKARPSISEIRDWFKTLWCFFCLVQASHFSRQGFFAAIFTPLLHKQFVSPLSAFWHPEI